MSSSLILKSDVSDISDSLVLLAKVIVFNGLESPFAIVGYKLVVIYAFILTILGSSFKFLNLELSEKELRSFIEDKLHDDPSAESLL